MTEHMGIAFQGILGYSGVRETLMLMHLKKGASQWKRKSKKSHPEDSILSYRNPPEKNPAEHLPLPLRRGPISQTFWIFFPVSRKKKTKNKRNCSARFSKYHTCKTDAQAPGYLHVTKRLQCHLQIATEPCNSTKLLQLQHCQCGINCAE
ncbi:hypothetical protein LZ24_01840 [Desulfobotulus alkaliphilus]|uniref:Uncharacterized protein n=1 Tax=Desulfobotulus alkaliphilus TaxID=622671 RepID=A0A562RS89_9BACT|nr:hypothetical protein LZ24_01840 [Desulfobotulus alkaliphilus]